MTDAAAGSLDRIVTELETRTPEGIAAAVSRLIHGGDFGVGTRLPTVRDVASALQVSPATVSNAWHALSGAGLIHSRGRAGSFVLAPSSPWMPKHYRELGGTSMPTRLDLSTGTPDPLLLPELGPALSKVPSRAHTENYYESRVLPELERKLRSDWPFRPGALTITDGALDAISRCLEAVVRYGDRAIVEEPGFPPILDLLEHFGVQPLPVRMDADGLLPDEFAAALILNPAAIILQPRAHNPTGCSMSATRARELSGLIETHSRTCHPIVIEDDHSGEISTAAAVSLGRWLPAQTVHIRSFAKSHGPDLRVGALAGASAVVERVLARRMLGPGWTSRMMQTVLYELLTASASVTELSEARMVYHARQRAMSASLVREGIAHLPADGINTWIQVRNERAAKLSLATAGIRVAGGQSFFTAPMENQQFLRVTVGRVREDFDQVGAMFAAAAVAD